MKKLLTFLTLLTLSIGVSWAAETVYYTLDGTITGGTNGYATVSQITQNSMDWEVTGNTTTNPWRLGGKNLTSENRPICSKTAMESAISKITVEFGTSNVTSVGGAHLYVYSDADMTTELDHVVYSTSITANSTIEITPTSGTEWATGAYYKLLITITVESSSNCYIQFKNAKFYKNDGGTQTPSHDITYDKVTGGSFSGPATAAEGSTVSISATPAAGYDFGNWNVYYTVDDENTPITVTNNQFTMPEYDVTVSGTFTEKTPYTINYTVGENGSLPSDKPTSAYSGDNVTITTTPADGYKLGSLTVTPTENGVDAPNVTITGNSASFVMPASNVDVAVTFEALPTYVFYEPFTGSDGTNNDFGQSTTTDGNGNNIVYSNEFGDFILTKGKGANNAIKLGTSGDAGSAKTPTITGLTSGKTYILTFKAAPWARNSTSMSVTATGGTLTGLSTSNMTNGQWNDYSATFVANGEEATFTFSASQNRFFLDEVMLDVAPDIEYNIYRTIKTNGEDNNEAGGWFGDWSNNCTIPNGTNGNHYTVTAPAGETVQFKAGTNNGYKILESHVSAVDANNTPVTLTKVSSDDSGIVFTFTMPASAVTITANFTDFYHPTLHLAGRFNGRPESAWITNSSGPEFTFDEDKDEYTINAYFTGAVNNNNEQIDYFYLRADNYDLKASADGDCWVGENGGTYNLGGSSNFRIHPGVYSITVTGSRKLVVITKVNPELSFNYPAGQILSGTTISATSNLAELITAIKNNDSGAQGEVSVKVCTDGSSYNLDEVTLSSDQTVYGKAWIGNLAVTENAAYTIHEFETETPDYTEAFSAGFGKFFADNSTIWTIYNSSCARASAYFNGAATASESWLYSPYIDLTASTNPKLSFSHSGNYFFTDDQSHMAEDVKVMIRVQDNNGWSGWTELDGVTYPEGNNSNTFVDVEKFMTSYIDQTIQIAFKYTSTTSRAGTWEIKNFKVAELYNITCNTADNGSITASPNPATAGETVTITVTPASGYELATLVYNDGTDHDIKATKSFTMPAANVTVTATFAEQQISPNDFQLVTDESQIKAGYEYVIASGDFLRVMGILSSSDNKAPCTDDFIITDDHSTITAGTDVNILTLDGETDAWIFKQKIGDQYQYIYLEDGKTNIKASSSENENGYIKTLNIKINDGDDKYAIITNVAYTTPEPSRQIEYQVNATSGNGQFGHYASSNVSGNNTAYTRVYLYYRGITPVVESKTLAEIEALENAVNVGTKYAIADEYLLAVETRDVNIDGTGYVYVWCKDNKNVTNQLAPASEEVVDFMQDQESQGQQGAWDQSNWVVLRFDGADQNARSLNGYKITDIVGTYVDNNNYMIDVESYNKGAEESYTPNVYCVANFNPNNWGANGVQQTKVVDGETVAYGDFYFFMTPKVQEVCEITFAEWNGTTFTVPSKNGFAKNTLTLDWGYNENNEGTPVSQETAEAYLNDNNVPDQNGKLPAYRFKSIVQRPATATGTTGAPALRDAITSGSVVYPMNFNGSSNEILTAINTVTVGNGQVKSVKYVNVAGMVSDTPFQGVNIVVTEYTDGTRTATKMLKK